MTNIATGDFLGLAQIALALAGFSTLATVLGTDSTGDPREMDVIRLQLLMNTTVLVLIFSLVPIALDRVGLRQELNWRLSSLALIGAGVGGSVYFARRLRELRSLFSRQDRITSWLAWPMDVVQYVCLVVVLVGAMPERAQGFYFMALCSNLIVGALMFVRVGDSLLRGSE